MLAFIIAFLFGAAQVWLTKQLIFAFNDKNAKKTFMLLGAKFAGYVFAVGITVLCFVWYISAIICGFAVGVPIAAIALFVYNAVYKK